MKWLFRTFMLAVLFTYTSCSSMSTTSGNCRLIAQTFFKSGKKEVDVSQEHAESYGDCRFLAQQRKLDSSFNDDVERATVIFSYREPSIIPPSLADVYGD